MGTPHMMRYLLPLGLLAFLGTSAQAQVMRPIVRASGTGVVSIKPDTLKISVGVTTQGNTAQEATDKNATIATAVLAQLRSLLGATADIKTVSYSVSPVYRNPVGGAPVLTGYTATNIFLVSTMDLSIGGRLIDTAAKAGANVIQGLSFTLKDSDPARQQALTLAVQQARAHAVAMAAGLGKGVGDVSLISESSSVVGVLTNVRDLGAGAAMTPVETGHLEVSASVVIEIALQ